MSRTHGLWRWLAASAAAGALALGIAAAAAAAQADAPERFTAFAVNLGSARVEGGRSGPVYITIERWSTPEERQTLVDALLKSGPDELLEKMRQMPRVGFIRTPDSVAWNLHYASQIPEEGGGRRVLLATDRRIGFWEVYNNTRTVDYPFTLLEMHLDGDGRGEGRMSVLTKITATADRQHIVLESYSSEPVRLQSIRATE